MSGRAMKWDRKRSQSKNADHGSLSRRAQAEYRAWEQKLNKYERRRLRIMDNCASGQNPFSKRKVKDPAFAD